MQQTDNFTLSITAYQQTATTTTVRSRRFTHMPHGNITVTQSVTTNSNNNNCRQMQSCEVTEIQVFEIQVFKIHGMRFVFCI